MSIIRRILNIMKRPFIVVPFLIIIPLAFMIILAYFLDKRQNFEPGGETFYMNYCSGCHGKKGNGRGITTRVKKLNTPNFTQPSYWHDKSDEYLLSVIKNGRDKMPAFEKFIMEPDRLDVLAYVKRKFKPKSVEY